MNLNILLLFVVIISAVLGIANTWQDPYSNSRSWIPISVGALLVAGISYWLVPALAGYISAFLWLVFGIVPSIGFRRYTILFQRGDYKAARRLATLLRWLHPSGEWSSSRAYLEAYDYAAQGRWDDVRGTLRSETSRVASLQQEMLVGFLTRDWQSNIEYWRRHPNRAEAETNPVILSQYVRALGEVGDLKDMLDTFEKYKQKIEKAAIVPYNCYLCIFAFCGRKEGVAQVLRLKAFAASPPESRSLWLATADVAAGNKSAGLAEMQPALQSKNAGIRALAQKRIDEGITVASEKLTPDAWQALSRIEQAFSIGLQLAKLA